MASSGNFNFSFGGDASSSSRNTSSGSAATGFNFSFGGSGVGASSTMTTGASSFAPAPPSAVPPTAAPAAPASTGFGGGFHFGSNAASASATTASGFGSGAATTPTGAFFGANNINVTTNAIGISQNPSGRSNNSEVANGTMTKNDNQISNHGISVPQIRALAWDPTGPAALSLAPLPGNSSSFEKDKRENIKDGDAKNTTTTVGLDVFLSHDGTGCTPEETECLLRLLGAREQWLQSFGKCNNNGNADGANANGVTELSMEYRAALCDCLVSLQQKLSKNEFERSENDDGKEDKDDDDDDDDEEEQANNIELLQLAYAVSHLTEIVLLPPLSDPGNAPLRSYSSGYRGNSVGSSSRLDGPPGALTADTIRYLRLHHVKGTGFGDLLESPDVLDMLESDQPEYYQFDKQHHSTMNDADRGAVRDIPGPYRYPYWNLLLHLIRQGELEQAWAVLSRNSACRRAEEEATAYYSSGRTVQMSPEGDGFAALRGILLSAPLAGGRGDKYCDSTGLDDYLEGDELESEEEEATTRGASGARSGNRGGAVEDMEEEEGTVEGINQLYMDGVPRKSYLLWESLPRRSDRLRTLRFRRELRRHGQSEDEEDNDAEAVLLPETFQPRAAMSAFRRWQDTVKEHVFGGGMMNALFRRFPPLEDMMQIIVGNVSSAVAKDPNMTWSERLLMELLYVRPDIMPEDIAIRAHVVMKAVGSDQGAFEKIVLSIMTGSAGQVVEVMFSLLGGASGAALPATVTSLLCNLLADAGCISFEKDSSSSFNTQTELLLIAAESILSSFAVQEESNIGVRSVVRLLLPHAPPKRIKPDASNDDDGESSQDEIFYEPRISSMISEAISHHLPRSDAEARDLLKLCEEAIRLGSVRIADTCESIAFSRAVSHGSKSDLGRQVHWLLRGMEVQSSWLPSEYSRTVGFASHRHFDALCENAAHSLISTLAFNASLADDEGGDADALSVSMRVATDVVDAVLRDDAMASVLKGHVQANLLKHVVDIAVESARGNSSAVAENIIHCLKETKIDNAVTTLASPDFYLELLHISSVILSREGRSESVQFEGSQCTKCAFGVDGMNVLMTRLTQVLSWDGVMCSHPLLSKKPNLEREKYYGALRLTFCKGLTRAFSSVGHSAGGGPKASANCGVQNFTLEEQVDLMLSPCI